MAEHYPFAHTPLGYEYVDLVPQIDSDTLYLHHAGLYARYVDALNYLLSGERAYQGWSLEELIGGDLQLPAVVRNGIRHYAGAVYAHRFYFSGMYPQGKAGDAPRLAQQLEDTYGSMGNFQNLFKQAARTIPGSGWVWLALESKTPRIVVTRNNEIPKLDALRPIVALDVWEHAYYLRYPARLDEYITGWFQILNLGKAERLYLAEERDS